VLTDASFNGKVSCWDRPPEIPILVIGALLVMQK
jgi:hypothetical protein